MLGRARLPTQKEKRSLTKHVPVLPWPSLPTPVFPAPALFAPVLPWPWKVSMSVEHTVSITSTLGTSWPLQCKKQAAAIRVRVAAKRPSRSCARSAHLISSSHVARSAVPVADVALQVRTETAGQGLPPNPGYLGLPIKADDDSWLINSIGQNDS